MLRASGPYSFSRTSAGKSILPSLYAFRFDDNQTRLAILLS